MHAVRGKVGKVATRLLVASLPPQTDHGWRFHYWSPEFTCNKIMIMVPKAEQGRAIVACGRPEVWLSPSPSPPRPPRKSQLKGAHHLLNTSQLSRSQREVSTRQHVLQYEGVVRRQLPLCCECELCGCGEPAWLGPHQGPLVHTDKCTTCHSQSQAQASDVPAASTCFAVLRRQPLTVLGQPQQSPWGAAPRMRRACAYGEYCNTARGLEAGRAGV